MNYIIIIVNIMIISLIIHNLFVKSDIIIESLENCPKDKKNIIFKQEAKIDNLFSQLNTLKYDITTLKKQITDNKNKSKENADDIETTGKNIENKAKAKEAELNKL